MDGNVELIVTVAAFKGGVGKTTSSIHIASYLQMIAPTLLVDGDPNRSSTGWAQRGQLTFPVVDETQAHKHIGLFKHVVIDTAARPTREELHDLMQACDLLVVPSIPDALSLHALLGMTRDLEKMGEERYKILITMAPPKPSKDGEEAIKLLKDAGLPHFKTYVRRAAAFQKAALAGRSVAEVKDVRAKIVWEDYITVGKEILGEQV